MMKRMAQLKMGLVLNKTFVKGRKYNMFVAVLLNAFKLVSPCGLI